MKIGYIGWLGHKNLGDDSCYEEFTRQITSNEISSIKVIHQTTPNDHVDYTVLGGGTLLSAANRHFDQLLSQLRASGRSYSIIGTGLQPFNISTIADWDDLHPGPEATRQLMKTLHRADIVGLRDTRSLDRARQLGIGLSPSSLMGDITLQFPPHRIDDTDGIMLREPGVAVNVGTSYDNIFGRNEQAVHSELLYIINRLIEWGHRVYLFPVWEEDLPVQTQLAQYADYPSRITELPLVDDYRVLVGTLNKMRTVIGMKLHSVIYALAADVPAVSIAYRDKCRSLLETYNLGHFSVRTDNSALSQTILDRYKEIQRNYTSVKRTIRFVNRKLRSRGNYVFKQLQTHLKK